MYIRNQGVNQNDIYLRLIKLQEENQRLKSQFVNREDFDRLVRENTKIKLELQK